MEIAHIENTAHVVIKPVGLPTVTLYQTNGTKSNGTKYINLWYEMAEDAMLYYGESHAILRRMPSF